MRRLADYLAYNNYKEVDSTNIRAEFEDGVADRGDPEGGEGEAAASRHRRTQPLTGESPLVEG
jgi:hypothetical protein